MHHRLLQHHTSSSTVDTAERDDCPKLQHTIDESKTCRRATCCSLQVLTADWRRRRRPKQRKATFDDRYLTCRKTKKRQNTQLQVARRRLKRRVAAAAKSLARARGRTGSRTAAAAVNMPTLRAAFERPPPARRHRRASRHECRSPTQSDYCRPAAAH